MEQLVYDERLIAPSDVYEELIRGDDEISRWAKQHKSMFRRQDAHLIREAKEVIRGS
jgi:hypothetical protein